MMAKPLLCSRPKLYAPVVASKFPPVLILVPRNIPSPTGKKSVTLEVNLNTSLAPTLSVDSDSITEITLRSSTVKNKPPPSPSPSLPPSKPVPPVGISVTAVNS